MLKLLELNKILILIGALAVLDCGFGSVRAQASSYLGAPLATTSVGGGRAASHHSVSDTNNYKGLHHLVSIRALGLFGSLGSLAEVRSIEELARQDLTLLAVNANPHLAASTVDLSLVSIIKNGGVMVHF
jgi:hypothetical protein